METSPNHKPAYDEMMELSTKLASHVENLVDLVEKIHGFNDAGRVAVLTLHPHIDMTIKYAKEDAAQLRELKKLTT